MNKDGIYDDINVEGGSQPPAAAEDNFMKEYFEIVNSIQERMATMRRNLLSIEEKYGQSLVAMNIEQGASEC
jgi:hypothetical protein